MDYNKIENLAMLARAGDKQAKEALVLEFTPLILKLSKKAFIHSYDLQDIKNECYKTLFKCVKQYNSEYHRFVAYATNAIRNSVNYLIRVSVRRNPIEGPETYAFDGIFENTLCSELEDFDIIIINKLYKHKLLSALALLNPSELDLITQVYYKNYTFKSYAFSKNISYGSLITQLNHILNKLRKFFNSEENPFPRN